MTTLMTANFRESNANLREFILAKIRVALA